MADQISPPSDAAREAHDTPAVGKVATLGKHEYTQVGEYVWERPAFVRFVLLTGCGGGGGGSSGEVLNQRYGIGGTGVPPNTIVVGPLEAASYSIRIGSGGQGGQLGSTLSLSVGQPGGDTSFKGADASQIFKGGAAGEPYSLDVIEGTNDSSSLNRTTFTFYGEPEGGEGKGSGGIAGERQPTATSGKPGGQCAGGGGGVATTAGGAGGSGYLALVPLADLELVEVNIEALLTRIAKSQASQAH
jgi:hypothetical protein